ncbi:MAG: hypothetical protein WAW69_15945 [Polaromonas sp.]
MPNFAIGETRYEGEKLVEVAIQCLDDPDGPFLYECEVLAVSEVVRMLKQGDAVEVIWRFPGGSNGSIPVEIVILPDGEESIEVVQRGQPEGYRMVNLPRLNPCD